MQKKQIPLRFDTELIELLREKAKSQRRSLNNYIEVVLYQDVGNIPNETTKAAIAEAREGENLEEIKDVDEFMNSL